MKKALYLITITFLIISCAPQYKWMNPSHSNSYIFNRDRSECDSVARVNARLRMAGQRQPQYRDAAQALVGGFIQGMTEGIIIQTEFDTCMMARGYYKEKIEQPTKGTQYTVTSEKDDTQMDKIELMDINLFEGDNSDEILQLERKYSSSFLRNNTRSVWVECNAKNNLWNVKDAEYEVTYIYTNLDKGLITGKRVETRNIRKEWETVSFLWGSGGSQSGKWEPGMYSADILVNGKEFASATFTITEDKPVVTEKKEEIQTEQAKPEIVEEKKDNLCELECIRMYKKGLLKKKVTIEKCIKEMCDK